MPGAGSRSRSLWIPEPAAAGKSDSLRWRQARRAVLRWKHFSRSPTFLQFDCSCGDDFRVTPVNHAVTIQIQRPCRAAGLYLPRQRERVEDVHATIVIHVFAREFLPTVIQERMSQQAQT